MMPQAREQHSQLQHQPSEARSRAAGSVADDDAARLLARFAADLGDVLPLIALWAHGPLASGDFMPGRSDLDLVALTGAPVTAAQRQGLPLPEWKVNQIA
jgi:hypothetical protein